MTLDLAAALSPVVLTLWLYARLVVLPRRRG
jgi:hypothetical protein